MKRTKIEQLLVVIAWAGLIGGILFTFLVSKGILESNIDMAFPQAVLTFVGGIGHQLSTGRFSYRLSAFLTESVTSKII